jgi:glycosyltransferase involved in cell wall biosynthesis
MHILILPSFYPDSFNLNLGKFFQEQVETLAYFGADVNVLYVERKSLKQLSIKKASENYFQTEIDQKESWTEYRIKGWNLPYSIGNRLWIYLTEKLITKYIKDKGKPDVIHVHNVFLAGIVAFKIYNKYNIKYIITEHDSGFILKKITSKNQSIALKIYLNASNIIAVSESLKNAIKEIGPKLKIEIIPNIVNTEFYKPSKFKLTNEGAINFLSIGNLNKNKGHSLLIEAFSEVLKLNKKANLIICGDGPERKSIEQLIKKLNLEKNVVLSGHIDKNKVLIELQRADCVVHTSYFETFGVVLIEAMACGVPFITTKSGGPEDVYEEGTGFLIEKGSVELLVQAMLSFIDNRNNFKSCDIRKFAIDKYGRENIFDKLMNCYLRI